MFKSRLLASVALAALCLPVTALSPALPFGATAAQAQSANISFRVFFDQLQPHGVWVRHARYQYVFCPTGVDASWRPYTHGRWLYVEGRGWYFASDEPFAWATYHYGRWFPDRNLGWCWVPGTKWAPAWVSWRRSDNVVGWAPLPPEEEGYAVSVTVRKRDLPAGYWVFVPTERFIEPDLSVNIVIGSSEPEYYTQTQFLGPVVIEGDVVVNNVIDVTYIEQNINQEIIVYQPEEAASPGEQSVAVEAQTIAVFDQDIGETDAETAPPEAVEEDQAAQAIEAEGGTAGATAEIAAEGEVEGQPAEGEAAPAAEEQPAASTEGGAEVTAPAPEEAAPSESSATEPAPPAAEPTETLPSETVPAEATEQQPAASDEPACPPETMVDGKCPVTEEEQPAAPAEQQEQVTPAPSEETAPPVEEAPAPEPASPIQETAPAATEEATSPEATTAPEEAAPAEVAPAPEEAAPAPEEAAPAPEGQPQDELPCPPEVRVNGQCPPVAQ